MGQRVLIMGAAGKDFHVFNTLYRGRPDTRVVAFTATQIPGIDGRRYPGVLAGAGYDEGIPIEPETRLEELIRQHRVDEVIFAYSDVSYAYLEKQRARVEATGAKFRTPKPAETMLRSRLPVVAVCAVRTGCGKSQTSRYVMSVLRGMEKRVVAVRHPMPYGDLTKQRVQRFASLEDLTKHRCTIEEMEEYEPHIRAGGVVFAGIDYQAILEAAEPEADAIIWDGGNNDTSFFKPTLQITLVDPHRPGHELTHYPGRENLELADIVLFNKMDSAKSEDVAVVAENVSRHNPHARRVYANSPIHVEDPDRIRGKRVVVVEDGPTLTHGGMKYGAGILAAEKFGAKEIVDPRPFLAGSLAETFEIYPGIGTLIPAMGYGEAQIRDLEATLDRVQCDTIIVATPIDLGRIVKFKKPSVRVTYELDDSLSEPNLKALLTEAFQQDLNLRAT